MRLNIDVDTNSPADKAALLALAQAMNGITSAPVVDAATDTGKPAKPARAAKPAAEGVKGNPDAPATGTAGNAAPATVTREQLAPVISELAKTKGREAAVAVLDKFRPDGFVGTVKVGDVPAAKYGELMAAAQAALAA